MPLPGGPSPRPARGYGCHPAFRVPSPAPAGTFARPPPCARPDEVTRERRRATPPKTPPRAPPPPPPTPGLLDDLLDDLCGSAPRPRGRPPPRDFGDFGRGYPKKRRGPLPRPGRGRLGAAPGFGTLPSHPARGPPNAPPLQALGPRVGAGPGPAASGVRFAFPRNCFARAFVESDSQAPVQHLVPGRGYPKAGSEPLRERSKPYATALAGAGQVDCSHPRARPPGRRRDFGPGAGEVTRELARAHCRPRARLPESLPCAAGGGLTRPPKPEPCYPKARPNRARRDAGPGAVAAQPPKSDPSYPKAIRPQTNNPQIPPFLQSATRGQR